MGRAGEEGKRPFSPWADRNAPAPCNENGHTTADECECDARWKWGYFDNYETCANVNGYDCLDGRTFIQREDDPFAFVDGDNVRDPTTGDVHPEFIAILDKLGLTYGDISQSGSGVHGFYRGDLPDGMTQATWQLESDPFGSNSESPSIEIYSGKHVCVMTGEHLPGTPEYARRWDDDALLEVLDDSGELPEPTGSTATDDVDRDGYEPDVTTAGEAGRDDRGRDHQRRSGHLRCP